MKVSLNIVRSLINFELPSVDELVLRVNQQLGGVEEVIDLGAKYSGARIVRVVECGKHPDADRLSVTKIDDGGAVPDVPRGKWHRPPPRIYACRCSAHGDRCAATDRPPTPAKRR